jgi:hypothetical protein
MTSEAKLKKSIAFFVKICGVARVSEWAGVSPSLAGRWQRQEFLPKPHHISAIWSGFQREFAHDEGVLRGIIHDYKELAAERDLLKATSKIEKKIQQITAQNPCSNS